MTTAAVEGTLPAREGSLSVHVATATTSSAVEKHPEQPVEQAGTASSSATISSKDSNSDGETSTGSSGRGQVDFTMVENSRIGSLSPDVDGDSKFLPTKNGVLEATSAEFSEDVIDSALLAALRDPRERLGLLKLEQAMVDFMNTSDGYIEVGGPFNSVVISPTGGMLAGASAPTDRPQTTFQRCILHRLADRFSIIRETGSLVDGYIRLVKLKDSRIPRKLLLHLDSSEYNNATVDEATKAVDQLSINNPGQSANGGNSNSTTVNSSKSRQRKMKIMKRNSSGDSFKNSGNGSSDSRSTPRKGKNFSDKEKAYAEARARIFSDQQGDSGGTIPPGTPAATSTVAPSPTATPPNSQPGLTTQSLENCVALDENEEEKSKGRGSTRSSSGAVSKATWRNRRQEENDPDFQRGGHMVVPQSYPADVYGGYTGGGTSSYPSQPGHQQKFYHAYAEDTNMYYAGQGQVPQQQTNYYNNPGRGRGRGFGNSPRYGGYGSNNNYYHQTHHHHQYHQGRTSSGEPANVNSLEDFPSLR